MYQFEFNAPKFYNFLHETEKSDAIQVDIAKPNDYWFMVTHAELTPIKKQPEKDQLIRKSVIKNNVQAINQTKQELPPPQIIKNKEEKKIVKQDKRIKFQLPNKRIVKEKSVKARIASVPSMNTRSKSNKVQKQKTQKVRVPPCPFPPRIQREWESKSRRKWYSLSLESSKKAREDMKSITHEIDNKKSKRKVGKPVTKKNIFRF